jgi:O-acetyl-ADP-ribose deacetylase (regulator of RNase III)
MQVVIGDIIQSRAQTIVNTVNCVGVMGKGIALEFKKHFPEMFQDYLKRCEAGTVKLGYPYLYKRNQRPWVLNFPTKGHWRSVSRLRVVTGFMVEDTREDERVPPTSRDDR